MAGMSTTRDVQSNDMHARSLPTKTTSRRIKNKATCLRATLHSSSDLAAERTHPSCLFLPLLGGDLLFLLQGDLTSVQAVEAIVSAKQKERLAELERRKLEVAAEHDRELQQAAEEHRALHEDNQQRKARGPARGEFLRPSWRSKKWLVACAHVPVCRSARALADGVPGVLSKHIGRSGTHWALRWPRDRREVCVQHSFERGRNLDATSARINKGLPQKYGREKNMIRSELFPCWP